MPNSQHNLLPSLLRSPLANSPFNEKGTVKVMGGTCASVSGSWLSDDLLLLVGSFGITDSETLKACVVSSDTVTPLGVRCYSFPVSDENPSAAPHRHLVCLRCPPTLNRRTLNGTLEIKEGDRIFQGVPSDVRDCLIDLPVLVRETLLNRSGSLRTEVLSFLNYSLTECQDSIPSMRLSGNLFVLREALRTRPPKCTLSPERPQGFHVDLVLKLDDYGYYMRGWVWDDLHPILRLSAISPEGSQAELLSGISTWPRADVDKYFGLAEGAATVDKGFISFFELPTPSYLASGWLAEMENAAGTILETKSLEVVHKPELIFQAILEDIRRQCHRDKTFLLRHAVPSLDRLNQNILRSIRVKEDTQFGCPLSAPELSLLVPLPKHIELLEHQLTQFVRDAELASVDIIYVGTDPAENERLREEALQLHRLYRLPFRLLTLDQAVSFPIAQRIGASLARGRLLVFCNPNVFPDQPGWLATMASFYRATPGIGVLGPKLLHEDDSVQHAGVYFARPEGSREWEVSAYYRGYHRLLPSANEPRVVPAVSGACLMIDRDLFLGMGGYRDTFLEHSCSAVDLCLRLQTAGRENWYVPTAELYNLEGLTCTAARHEWQSFYNECMLARVWGERLGSILTESSGRTPASVHTITSRYKEAEVMPGQA